MLCMASNIVNQLEIDLSLEESKFMRSRALVLPDFDCNALLSIYTLTFDHVQHVNDVALVNLALP